MVHQIGFNLYDDSPETITIKEINFYDQYDVLKHNIAESEIIDVWGTGEVEPYSNFSGYISFQITEVKQEVEQWEIRWLCTDEYQQDFTVIGTYYETTIP